MTRIGMVKPVMMIAYIVRTSFTLHTTQRGFSTVPKMIVRERTVTRVVFHIQRSVSFLLVCVTAGSSIEEIHMVYPSMLGSLQLNTIIIEVNQADVTHLHFSTIVEGHSKTVECSIIANTL